MPSPLPAIPIRMPRETQRELDTFAQEDGRSRHSVLVEAVGEWLERRRARRDTPLPDPEKFAIARDTLKRTEDRVGLVKKPPEARSRWAV